MNYVEAAMADGVLLDTSFLISFADRNRPQHAVAVQFFNHFGMVECLDAIPIVIELW